MGEVVRTSDPAILAVVESLLLDAGIPCHIADRHASLMGGNLISVLPRVMVPDDREAEARELLDDADLGKWVRR
jgi:hypothetical protein